MLLLLILTYVYIYLINKEINNFSKNNGLIIKKYLLIGIIFEILLLIIYRVDLYTLGRDVYYSDAQTYWKHTLELLNLGETNGYNPLYFYVCYILQKTSPFIWVGWNNIFNILCVNYTILIVINIISKMENVSDNNKIGKIKLLIINTMFNPFIIYSLMRNLKDAFFILLLFIIIYITYEYFRSKKSYIKIFLILLLLFLIYLIPLIRPWGFIIPIIAITYIFVKRFCYFVINSNRKIIKSLNSKKIIIISIIIIIVGIFIFNKIYPAIILHIKAWYPIVLKNFKSISIIDFILGFLKFIFAPGPIRSILGHKYFMYYTITGNIMCFFGQLLIWMMYIVIFANIFITIKDIFKKEKKLNLILQERCIDFIIPLVLSYIFYLSIYIIQYGGGAEHRLRAGAYIMLISIFIILFDVKKFNNYKKVYIVSAIMFMGLYTIITLIGV